MAASTTQYRPAARFHSGNAEATECEDENEFREHQHFGKNTVRAHHQRGSKRHEVAGDMREEKSLQPEKSGGVDEPGIETEELKMTAGLHRLVPQVAVRCGGN
jgi:hypothetical protein